MDRALVTGASSGIGKELSLILLKRGYFVTLLIRDQNRDLSFCKEYEGLFEVFLCDLANPNSRYEVVKKIEEEPYSLIINNAGFGLYGPVMMHDQEEEKALVEVNVQAVFDVSLAALRSFKKFQIKGTILNVSSIASIIYPFPLFTTYSATKAFVTSFSRSLDRETAKEGIRVLVALPGQVQTPFRKKAAKSQTEESKSSMSAYFAANKIMKQIDKKKGQSVFNWPYKLLEVFYPFIPSFIIEFFVKKNISNRL